MDDSGPIRGLLLDSGDTLIRPIGGESFPGRASHASIATRAIHPAHHILGVRRELFEQQPDVAREIYEAVEQSKLH